ncbi:galactan 5-O-arabinofuranosyltransferase [Rhodococcus sp. HNM0569]|uniref:galactan 5-O-arabinofuranosyltransferase n=1 Tax=Rhodococcus sp. HNM0569 TaxID=2716340 RepID=UPI003211F881
MSAVAAVVVAAAVSACGLVVFGVVSWPAFSSSNVLRAVTTVGQVLTLAVIAVSVWLVRRRRAARTATLLSWAGLSGFVTVSLGLPLAATKLYLHGVSVDQEFRTQYLTRLTDSAALRDMNYADIPPFYPAGWFWLGGRAADLLGLDGWEAFKPYSICSLAVAAVLALVLWTQLVRRDLAIVAATVTAVVTVTFASPEPYSAVVILLTPPALVLAWGALHRRGHRGGWAAVVGTGLFLGLAATFYTLFLGWTAFTVVLMALVAAAFAIRRDGTWRAALAPAVRLVVIAVISGLVALIVWTPYLLAALRGEPADSGTAMHYLPASGAGVPLPMIDFSLTGAMCLLGTVWLVVRATTSRRAAALGIGVLAVYAWYLLSMTATAAGSTLLAFRLEPMLVALLGVAAVFGFVEFSHWIVLATSDNSRVRVALVVVASLCLVSFAQNIPQFLAGDIAVAYSDTDGDGERGDRKPPGAASYYPDVDAALTEQLGRPRDEIVVLTTDTTFLSYYPYFGFQALTSHYANPLAQFRERAEVIEQWTELDSPDALVAALDDAPWRAPDAFVLREDADGYTLRLTEDVYPNDPNVRRYTVTFPKEVFDDPRFTVSDTGPFVVVTRNS